MLIWYFVDKIVLTDLNNNYSCLINVVECDVRYFSHIEEHKTENTQIKYLKLWLKVQCVGFSDTSCFTLYNNVNVSLQNQWLVCMFWATVETRQTQGFLV